MFGVCVSSNNKHNFHSTKVIGESGCTLFYVEMNCVVLFLCFQLSLVSTSSMDCLERLVSKMTCYVSIGM